MDKANGYIGGQLLYYQQMDKINGFTLVDKYYTISRWTKQMVINWWASIIISADGQSKWLHWWTIIILSADGQNKWFYFGGQVFETYNSWTEQLDSHWKSISFKQIDDQTTKEQ